MSFFLKENKNKRQKKKKKKTPNMHVGRRLNHYAEEAWAINDNDGGRPLWWKLSESGGYAASQQCDNSDRWKDQDEL